MLSNYIFPLLSSVLLIISIGFFTRYYFIRSEDKKEIKRKLSLQLNEAYRYSLPIQIIESIDSNLTALLGIQLYSVIQPQNIHSKVLKVKKGTLFGDQSEIAKGAELFVAGFKNLQLTVVGRAAINYEAANIARARYINEHPEIADIKIKSPLIILGLPRTGSTLLYNLLACDAQARCPKFWEMYGGSNPTPPAKSPEESHHAIREIEDGFKSAERISRDLLKDMRKSHYFDIKEPEEDYLILMHQYVLLSALGLASDEYREWFYAKDNKEAVYEYHYRYLQMLSSGYQPSSHWLLKCPVHALFLDSLVSRYPDARIVFIHRHPEAVLPSLARLLYTWNKSHLTAEQLDPKHTGKIAVEYATKTIQRISEFRDQSSFNNLYDIRYEDLMEDPIHSVHSLYAHFKMPVSKQFTSEMSEYLKDNQQGKHGKVTVSASDFGISRQDINTFSAYISKYKL